MLFRYKIEECCYDGIERAFHGPGIGYLVKIQYYKPDAHLFKWRCFNYKKLSGVLYTLRHATDDIDTNEGLFIVLYQYSSIGEIVLKYIKELMKENEYQKLQKDIEDKISNFVVTNGWNTIEIKENE